MAKTLRADIVIGGKADGSFYALGDALGALGSQLNGISSKLIDFGIDSTKTYASYEDAMLDAQVAMRTQYKSTNELQKAMEQLDGAAQQWASDSRFTTQDVAGAISEAAHAGWDLQQIMNGVPAAMRASLAGGMSLSEGLEYLIDISNAAGLGFGELSEFVDTWAFAANSASTTIPEMGAAMQKMGATMQFVKGDMPALTTMLAVLADNGAKGTEAGTLLRNSMIRLIAPTKTAAQAMEGLALTGEDLEEIYSGTANLTEVSKMLEEAGFSAYDSSGNLKGFLNIFQELNAVTSAMTEQDRNKVLSTIFPTRTITGALALLDAANEGWGGLYDTIKTGSQGYAEYAAQTMESGLGGALRHLESVYDALKTKTGGALSEEVSWGADILSGLIERVNGMDGAAFNGLVSGLTAVAAAGPGLMMAGGITKLVGMLAGTGPGGWIALGATAIAALTAGLISYKKGVEEANFEDSFGSLALNSEKMGSYLESLGTHFQDTREQIDEYKSSLEQALDAYITTSSGLKGGLWEAMLTKETLSASAKNSLNRMGDQMVQELLSGIRSNYSADEAAILELGDLVSMDGDDSMAQQIMRLLEAGEDGAVEKARALGSRLKEALANAFADGEISVPEIGQIQDIMDQMNSLAAEQADKEVWMETQALMRDAQTMGMAGIQEISDRAAELRDKSWANEEKKYSEAEWGIWKAFQDNYGKTIEGITYDDAWYEKQVAYLDQQRSRAKFANDAQWDGTLLDLFGAAMQESGFGGLKGLAERYMSGETDMMDDFNALANEVDYENLYQAMERSVTAMGGYEEILARADYYRQNGQEGMAREMETWAVMSDLAKAMSGGSLFGQLLDFKDAYPEMSVRPELGQETKMPVIPKVETDGLENQIPPVPVKMEPSEDGMGLAELENAEVNATVNADTSGAEAGIDALNGTEIETEVIADTGPAQAAIDAVHGKTVVITVITRNISVGGGGGGGGAMSNALDVYSGYYAEGGRAEEASVFGEAGPEWAIPERHTERTAELLNAAREASGFTWPELYSKYGDGNPSQQVGYKLVYSPTIMAADASGVEEKLREDKDRLEKWLMEKKLHDDVEVYA